MTPDEALELEPIQVALEGLRGVLNDAVRFKKTLRVAKRAPGSYSRDEVKRLHISLRAAFVTANDLAAAMIRSAVSNGVPLDEARNMVYNICTEESRKALTAQGFTV